MKYSWTDGQIKTLFKTAECYKKNHKPLLQAFENFAKNFGRKTESVRNFYYQKLKEIEKNKALQEKYQIKLENHSKINQDFFTEQETEKIINKINSYKNQGYSVRFACLKLSNGDIKKMIRLQNKYRNYTKNAEKSQKISKKSLNIENKPLLNPLNMGFSDNKTIIFQNLNKNSEKIEKNTQKIEKNDKIINFSRVIRPQNFTLSDQDITNLFMGLVKLVKNSAEEEANLKFDEKVRAANQNLRQTIKNLADKERQYSNLEKKFNSLTKEKTKLLTKLQDLRSKTFEPQEQNE